VDPDPQEELGEEKYGLKNKKIPQYRFSGAAVDGLGATNRIWGRKKPCRTPWGLYRTLNITDLKQKKNKKTNTYYRLHG